MTAALEMIYFADPMCSWCYAFAPVIVALAERLEARLPLRLMLGGLRAGNTEADARGRQGLRPPGLDRRWARPRVSLST